MIASFFVVVNTERVCKMNVKINVCFGRLSTLNCAIPFSSIGADAILRRVSLINWLLCDDKAQRNDRIMAASSFAICARCLDNDNDCVCIHRFSDKTSFGHIASIYIHTKNRQKKAMQFESRHRGMRLHCVLVSLLTEFVVYKQRMYSSWRRTS